MAARSVSTSSCPTSPEPDWAWSMRSKASPKRRSGGAVSALEQTCERLCYEDTFAALDARCVMARRNHENPGREGLRCLTELASDITLFRPNPAMPANPLSKKLILGSEITDMMASDACYSLYSC